jgi:two-component system sensor histidine kinase UhpB
MRHGRPKPRRSGIDAKRRHDSAKRRKQLAEALRANEELFRTTFENAAVGIAHVTPDGRWLRVNDKLCQILGYTREQLSARTFLEITHPDDIDGNLELLKRALAGEIRTYAIEKRYFRSDGSIMWSNLSVSLIRDRRTNKPLYFISVIEDITARKQAEQALRESEERLQLALDGGSLGTWHLDMVSGQVLRDRRAEEIIGLPPDSPRDEATFHQIVHPDDRDKLLASRRQAIAERRAYASEFRVQRPDGTFVWVLNRSKPVYNESGNVVGLSGICVDITERKAAESALQRINEELERRVTERTTELIFTQAQLRALAGRLHVLQEEERSELARELHDEFGAAFTALKVDLHWILARLPKHSDGLEEKARVMSELIDNSVDSVRRTAGLLRPRLLDDFGLVAAIEWQIEEFSRRTGIQCVTNFPEEVAIDRSLSTAIFRILQEALTNVVRHAQATEVRVDLRLDNRKVWIEIEDNGKGLDNGAKANDKSLGLFGMQERAYAFGGQVRFASQPKQGTTVTVEIPLEKTV